MVPEPTHPMWQIVFFKSWETSRSLCCRESAIGGCIKTCIRMSGCIYRLLYNYTHTTQGGTIGRCVIAEACIKLLQMKFQCNNCFLSVQALIIYNNNQTTSLANLVQFKSSFCIRTLNTCIRPPFCNFVWLWLIVRSVTAATCDQVLVPTCALSVIVIVIVGIATK